MISSKELWQEDNATLQKAFDRGDLGAFFGLLERSFGKNSLDFKDTLRAMRRRCFPPFEEDDREELIDSPVASVYRCPMEGCGAIGQLWKHRGLYKVRCSECGFHVVGEPNVPRALELWRQASEKALGTPWVCQKCGDRNTPIDLDCATCSSRRKGVVAKDDEQQTPLECVDEILTNTPSPSEHLGTLRYVLQHLKDEMAHRRALQVELQELRERHNDHEHKLHHRESPYTVGKRYLDRKG